MLSFGDNNWFKNKPFPPSVWFSIAESQNAHFSKLIAEMKGRRVGIGINGIATPPNTPTTDGGSPHSSTEVPGEERSLDLNGDFDTGMVLAVESPEALKRGGVAGDEDFDLTTSTIPERLVKTTPTHMPIKIIVYCFWGGGFVPN